MFSDLLPLWKMYNLWNSLHVFDFLIHVWHMYIHVCKVEDMCHYIMSEKEERGREEHSKIILLVQYNYMI